MEAASFAAGDDGGLEDEFAYAFAVNVADLVEQGVTHLEMSFRSALLRLPIEAGSGRAARTPTGTWGMTLPISTCRGRTPSPAKRTTGKMKRAWSGI